VNQWGRLLSAIPGELKKLIGLRQFARTIVHQCISMRVP
jgi:hypothetical protein